MNTCISGELSAAIFVLEATLKTKEADSSETFTSSKPLEAMQCQPKRPQSMLTVLFSNYLQYHCDADLKYVP
jgi:hypothetical protein